MDYRCANCLASQWIDRDEVLRHSDTLECSGCGKTHEAKPVPALGSTLGSHYRQTFEFANKMQIDMPSAYSVLLQLMTLNELRADRGSAKPGPAEREPEREPAESSQDALFPDLSDEELGLLERLASAEESGTPSSPEPFDDAHAALFPELTSEELDLLELIEADDSPRFGRAVAKGHLTEQEAMRRGNRTDYAHAMAKRHRLPMRLAYAVADNRITLRKALLFGDAAHKLRQPTPPPARQRVHRGGAALVIAVATTMVGLATWGLWSRNFEPEQLEIRRAQSTTLPAPAEANTEPAPTGELATHQQALRSATAVVTDETGRITQVTGPDPGNVLRAFCKNAEGSEFFEPTEVTETVPPSREARLGVFRDLQSLTANQAIRIRRDRQTRRWVAGDGVHPVQVMRQPDLPAGALRISAAAH